MGRKNSPRPQARRQWRVWSDDDFDDLEMVRLKPSPSVPMHFRIEMPASVACLRAVALTLEHWNSIPGAVCTVEDMGKISFDVEITDQEAFFAALVKANHEHIDPSKLDALSAQ